MAVGASKLNEEKVIEIKTLLETTDLSSYKIAAMYGVSPELIRLIRTGKRWNHITRSFISKKEMRLHKVGYELTEKDYTLKELLLLVWKKVVSLRK